jgi:hypothetical protein
VPLIIYLLDHGRQKGKIIMKKKRKEDPKNLLKQTHKMVNTVGELKNWLKLFNDDEPILISSDEELNQVNKILYMELFEEGLILIPWEQWGVAGKNS